MHVTRSAASMPLDMTVTAHGIQPATGLGTKRVNKISRQNSDVETTGKSNPLPNKWDVLSSPKTSTLTYFKAFDS